MPTQLSQPANLIMQKLKLSSLNDQPSGVIPFLDEAPHALHIKLIDGKNKKVLEELKSPSLITDENHEAVDASNWLECYKRSMSAAN